MGTEAKEIILNTSEQIDKFMPAFLAAQKDLDFAAKNKVNPHLKSKYADLPEVIQAVKSSLNAQGIAFLQTPDESEPAVLKLTTRLIHESGQWIESVMTLPLVKTDPQGYGSAMTYARRYALSAITGIYADDDDDGQLAAKRKKKETISATDGAFEKLPAPKQHALLGISEEIIDLHKKNDFDKMMAVYREVSDNDERIALWSLLPSYVRTQIKKLSKG